MENKEIIKEMKLEKGNTMFERMVYKTNEVNLRLDEYLRASLNSDNKDLCRGWDYLKNNLTKELKETLTSFDYWKKSYNSDKEKVILQDYLIIYAHNYILNEKLKGQLGSLVYVWNDIKAEIEANNREDKLKNELLEEGFIYNDNLNIQSLKELDELKCFVVMDVNMRGIMGDFHKTERIEGKFLFNKSNNGLVLIPKRSRTRGYQITKRFFYKIKNGSK